ncbi:coiled-coil domain-containing protein 157 isoform X2 [Strongylocentrotus purpuratus]|uniref:Coiled-coil domain-containing protein 157 n=1 Tax=Strongylocentrotus purpuratus TaxID=7668 RepID=A0A7M7PAI7_STRPU|nr:coiled-coil domain-containing protein 157 isoform X2 [Strongylocentrotus purpuratus]
MAHMLGGKYCLESLGRDVGDLQSAVADSLSRVGPVRYPSWKFPDKVSSDVDIEELLEDYKFSEDEEDNQVAHVILFELVIDRMVLLLQSFTRFVEQLIQGTVGRPPTATPMGTQMSIGLVVKKFWNKIVQLNSITQKLSAESKSKGRTINKLEVINVELQEQLRKTMQSTNMSGHLLDSHVAFVPEGDSDDQGISAPEAFTSSKSQMAMLTPQPSAHQVIAIDTRTTSSQTLETAFVPCEACERVQLCLRDVGETITDVCQSQKLPSSIARHRKQLPGDVLSAMDVSRWTMEQNKDLDRIKDHLSNLMAQIHPLEAELAASQEACERLTENVSRKDKDLKSANVSHGTEVKQFEAKVKEIERQHAESIMVVKRSYEEARGGKKKTEEELTKLKRELQRQYEALKELEGVREELNQTLDANTTNQASVNRLESHVTQLSRQLNETQGQLTESSRQLGKEQAKNRSIDKHGQALQSKHDALVQRVEELDQECQDLREGLADAEDGKEEVLEQLKATQSELQGLQDEFKTQQDLVASITEEKKFLESSVGDLQTMILALEEQLKDTQEREKMLILYPDTNPGLVPAAQRADGDSASGMGQRVQTNNVRIQILEEQNNLLRNNIDKLLAGQEPQGQSGQVNGPGIPLWQADSLKQARQSVSVNNNHANARSGKSPRSPRGHLDPIHIPNGHHPLDEHLTEEEVIAKYTKQSSKNRQYSPSSEEATTYQIPPRPPFRKGNRDKTKPKSGKRTSSQSGVDVAKLSATTNPSLHAYRTLKSSGAIGKPQPAVKNQDGPDFFVGNRTPAANSRHAVQQSWKAPDPHARSEGTQSRNSYYEPGDTFICQQCDKMYDNKRDLDIHKSYCYP